MLISNSLSLFDRLILIHNRLDRFTDVILRALGQIIQNRSWLSIGLSLSFLLKFGVDLHHAVSLKMSLLALPENFVKTHSIPAIILVLFRIFLLINNLARWLLFLLLNFANRWSLKLYLVKWRLFSIQSRNFPLNKRKTTLDWRINGWSLGRLRFRSHFRG